MHLVTAGGRLATYERCARLDAKHSASARGARSVRAPAKLAKSYARQTMAVPLFRERSGVGGIRSGYLCPYGLPGLLSAAMRQLAVQPRVRRAFLECETGTHTLVPVSRDKRQATVRKVERYETFLAGLADVPNRVTPYTRKYPRELKAAKATKAPSRRSAPVAAKPSRSPPRASAPPAG